MLEPRTQETLSQDIKFFWVYRVSIEQAVRVFASNDLTCFGRFRKEAKRDSFIREYNKLFNLRGDSKKFNSDKLLLRLCVKELKLRSMYQSIVSCSGDNARKSYRELFGKEYDKDGLKLILSSYEKVKDQISIMSKPVVKKPESISLSRLIVIIEDSKSIPIDRNIKVFEFWEIYNNELKKNGRH